MAILTRFTRDDRALDVVGCPLGSTGGDASACASCRFNALVPGESHVGCVVQTASAELEQALSRLEVHSAADHRRLRELLSAQAMRREDQGLSDGELKDAAAIAERWARTPLRDERERQVCAILVAFTRAGLAHQRAGAAEPIRLFS